MHLLLLVFLSIESTAQNTDANPVEKIIELLDSPAAKIAKEGAAQEKAFQVFSDWCTETTRSKGFGIQTANSQIAKLETEIDKQKGDAEAS